VRALTALDVRPHDHVLEIGCGTGINFEPIVRRLDPSAGRLLGIDFSPAMLARAARRIAARGWANTHIMPVDACRFAVPDRFDRILLSYALSIIPDWTCALRRAVLHLRPGGIIVVVDFGAFERWGAMRPLMYRWLRANHTSAGLGYEDVLQQMCERVSVEKRGGGYYHVVWAKA
jgi:ubiquinone/menaquinone biosynthesis C-methylase UbiE